MLMALSNADRSSDLAALDLNFRAYTGDGVRFVIPGLTKTRRNGPPLEVFYPSFPENPRVSSHHITVLRMQIKGVTNSMREMRL
jgi:hypothetical protein